MEPSKVRKNHPPFFRSVRNYFREYCNYSSIHGFRYFGEKRTYFERGLWFLIFAATLVGCVIAIREVYLKWVRSPVIVSFATKETPIYSIPFPAVTICPESKSNQSFYNHTSMLRKQINKILLTKNEQKLLDYMGMICDKNNLKFSDTEYFTDDFFEKLQNISQINPFLQCEYIGQTKFCNKLFKPIITDEGICYTFNMLDRSEIYSDIVVHFKNFHTMENLTYGNWSMDKGYSDDAGLYTYPHRALLAGAQNSLSIVLITGKGNIDHTCKNALHGFRVMLHTPMRIPRPSQQYFRVPLNQDVLAAIQPVMITTSESVQDYNSKKRQCYFPIERRLKYFKIYTSLNCKLECLTNYTLYYCGCVNYFMPRENNTDICGIGNADCMKRAEQRLQMGDLRSKIVDKNVTNSNRTKNRFTGHLPHCDCLPICSDLSYDVETSQTDWDWLNMLKSYSKDEKLNFEKDDYHVSKLTLYFKSSQFITSQRHELYGPTDFLANFGGLLGLFTGFSVLSLMEAIYFLTIRLCCNTRLYGYWAGPDN